MKNTSTARIGRHEVSIEGFAIKQITLGRPFGAATAAPQNGLWVNLRVDAIEGYGPVEVSWVEALESAPDDAGVLGELVRAAVLKALAHEVDERLRVNGALLRTPHPELVAVVEVEIPK